MNIACSSEQQIYKPKKPPQKIFKNKLTQQ